MCSLTVDAWVGARRARKQGLSAGFRTRPALLKCATSKIFVWKIDGTFADRLFRTFTWIKMKSRSVTAAASLCLSLLFSFWMLRTVSTCYVESNGENFSLSRDRTVTVALFLLTSLTFTSFFHVSNKTCSSRPSCSFEKCMRFLEF